MPSPEGAAQSASENNDGSSTPTSLPVSFDRVSISFDTNAACAPTRLIIDASGISWGESVSARVRHADIALTAIAPADEVSGTAACVYAQTDDATELRIFPDDGKHIRAIYRVLCEQAAAAEEALRAEEGEDDDPGEMYAKSSTEFGGIPSEEYVLDRLDRLLAEGEAEDAQRFADAEDDET